MIHLRLPISAVLCLSTVLTTACSVHFGSFLVSGKDAQTLIDDKLVTRLRVALPGVQVSASSCPTTMDLANDRVGRCVIRIAHFEYPVKVWFNSTNGQLQVAATANVFMMATVEKYVQTTMKQYVAGAPLEVYCGQPRIRMYRVGDRFSCALRGRYRGVRVWLKNINANAMLFVYRPKEIPETADQLAWDQAAAKHKRGEATLVPGSLAENQIRSSEQENQELSQGANSRFLGHLTITGVKCPQTLDLTGERHGRCLEYINNAPLRIDIWIDKTGSWNTIALDNAYYLPDIALNAVQYYRKLLLAAGYMRDVQVRCGSAGVIIVTPPSSRRCSIKTGSGDEGWRPMYIEFRRGGTFEYFVPEKNGP